MTTFMMTDKNLLYCVVNVDKQIRKQGNLCICTKVATIAPTAILYTTYYYVYFTL